MFTYDTKSCVYRIRYVMIVYEWSFHTIFSCQTVSGWIYIWALVERFFKLWSVSVCVLRASNRNTSCDLVKAFRTCRIQEHLSRLRFPDFYCHDLRRRLKSLRRSAPYAEIVRGKSKKNLNPTAWFRRIKRCVQSWPFEYALRVRRAYKKDTFLTLLHTFHYHWFTFKG